MRCTTGLPFLLEKGMEVAFVPPQLDVPRRGRVRDIELLDERRALMYVDTVTSMETAEALVGCAVLARFDELPAEAREGEWRLEGYEVYDRRAGMLGTVTAIEQNPAHPLLCVGKDILIPCVEEFIVDINDATRVITTEVPAGLIELNRTDDAHVQDACEDDAHVQDACADDAHAQDACADDMFAQDIVDSIPTFVCTPKKGDSSCL